MENKIKKMYGQFFTIANPFDVDIFYKWYSIIPEQDKEVVLEPFAGVNNILNLLSLIDITPKWECYDIDEFDFNNFEEYPVKRRDTIKNFPKGFSVGITNPPYLAKNSATRSEIDFPDSPYDDLYKISLSVMLENLKYIAAIIPESFITQNLFHDRLYAVVSLSCRMFDDTEHPVCLALFVPKKDNLIDSNNFKVYHHNRFIDNYAVLRDQLEYAKDTYIDWKFNVASGEIGVFCVDSIYEPSIRFVKGSSIPSCSVKESSRAITRISGIPKELDVDMLIEQLNIYLKEYREMTKDVFLTAFKGIRKDGNFRRRLDYKTIRRMLNLVCERMLSKK